MAEDKRQKDVDDLYDEFWKEIVEKDGVLDKEQVKKELYDYTFVLAQVAKVYSHVTGGLLSKANYFAETVIMEADAYMQIMIDEAIAEDREIHGEEQ